MGKFRKLILLSGAVLFLLAIYKGWNTYGPGWKRLTPDSGKWNVQIHEGGLTTEVSTTFEISNIESFGDFSFSCSGQTHVTVLINDLPVAQLNGFNIHPSAFDGDVLIRPYYDVIPHVLDSKARWALKEGVNTLKLFVQTSSRRKVDIANWGLDSEFKGFSLKLGNAPEVRGRKWSATSGIPVIRLNVPGNEIPDEPKVGATMSFESADTLIREQSVKLEARGRSSIGYDQKSFSLRVTDSNGKAIKLKFPGFSENANFILYAPLMDLSLVRNALAYDLSRGMGHYAPRCIPVELIINDHYRGLYYLMEKIDVSTDRVPVDYVAGDENNPRNNGFLVEINPADPGDEILYTKHWNYLLHRPGQVSMPEGDYRKIVASQLDMMVSSVYQQLDAMEEVIDFQSFADYIILQECSKNIDAYRLSTFFYKTHEDTDRLIYAGPVWDFNLAFGLSDEMQGRAAEGWIHEQHQVVDTFWTALCSHPKFNVYLKNRYRELRSGLLSDAELNTRIDSLVARIEPVRDNHFGRYPWPSAPSWPYPEIKPDYLAETEAMKEFLKRRLKWLDGQWGGS
ncbi:MAG: hypothetical protein RL220_406 [Bacteroidota bacterium]